jgi:Fur family transcriptional regulator, zinc uptake regulator
MDEGPIITEPNADGPYMHHDGAAHHHHGAELSTLARDVLAKRGERWTDMRAVVFDVLAGFTTPASAYDIADRVSTARGKRIAPNSIYRILDLFVATNLAKRVEVANAFVVNSHPGCVHDCIFLICDDCGQVTHVDNDRIAADVRGAGGGVGFTANRPIIELTGQCAQCRA